jgi:hypothetical protein
MRDETRVLYRPGCVWAGAGQAGKEDAIDVQLPD